MWLAADLYYIGEIDRLEDLRTVNSDNYCGICDHSDQGGWTIVAS